MTAKVNPHRSSEAQAIARDGTILRVVVGSTVHGLGVGDQDDRDEMGMCVEPPEYLLGVRQLRDAEGRPWRFEQAIERTQPEGARSGPGDLDRVTYSLRKWARLALAGNPSVLLPLFVPPEHVMVQMPAATDLRPKMGFQLSRLGQAFMSRRVGTSFLGYLRQQRARLDPAAAERDHRPNRPELVERYGYDTKYAGHVIRLGLQGIELLTTLWLSLPMRSPDREYVLRVRTGGVPLIDVLALAGHLEVKLEQLTEATSLPPEPDEDLVNDWLTRTYVQEWRRRRLVW